MRRISVCGTSGSGKTTFAQRLAAKLAFPHVELDAVYHLPDWGECPEPEFRAAVTELTSADAWVVDGNYKKVRDIVWDRADTIIWLDYSLPRILWRLTRRTFTRGLTRQVLWHGNRESLWRHLFTRESLYLWVLQTYRRRRIESRKMESSEEMRHVNFLRFTSPWQAEHWLRSLSD